MCKCITISVRDAHKTMTDFQRINLIVRQMSAGLWQTAGLFDLKNFLCHNLQSSYAR